MELGGKIGCVTRANRFIFVEDSKPDPDTITFLGDSSVYCTAYLKKLWTSYDKTWWMI